MVSGKNLKTLNPRCGVIWVKNLWFHDILRQLVVWKADALNHVRPQFLHVVMQALQARCCVGVGRPKNRFLNHETRSHGTWQHVRFYDLRKLQTSAPSKVTWVLVKGCNLSGHYKETILFTIVPYDGNLNSIP